MKIEGNCDWCKRKKAIVGFSATIVGSSATIINPAKLYSTGQRKLCLACFQDALQQVSEVSQNLGIEARQ